ncbi:four helix bundle protein [Myxosarcina sp. GI1]|uniref:four helix bundle protein n=1 Tax=Myxosarcina sp. GI1 TaxID=1541065 RepID=UPI00055BB2DF|nr:four helix bundle protein [Myxosarcina sp. GI1]
MSDEKQKIQERTLSFAVRIVKLCKFLEEQSGVTRILYKQLIRSGTSIGANVREAQSAQSDRDFLHKLEIALKETRETEYWLIILVRADLIKERRIKLLQQECEEIIKILVAITKKIKQKIKKS